MVALDERLASRKKKKIYFFIGNINIIHFGFVERGQEI
jgi:hypothetical protein